MGTDCNLLTEKGNVYLDRYYTFNSVFQEFKEYNKKEFLEKLKECKEIIFNNYEESLKDEYDQKCLGYALHWIIKAEENCGERNTIIAENNSYDIDEHRSKNIDSLITYYGGIYKVSIFL